MIHSKLYVSIILSFVLFSCSSDDKATQIIEADRESGAFVRTLSFNNSDLIQNDLTSTFSVNLEVQDEDQGALLDRLEVFVTFNDNTPDNGAESSQEVLIRTLGSDVFTEGSSGLPRHTLALTQSELLSATNISPDNVQCQDQFQIRLKLNLTDGRSFSVEDGSSSVVIAFDTLFSSPFCYTVNIVEPIDTNQFIGMYQYTSIVNGPFGPTFGTPKIVEIKRGSSINSRIFEADYIVSRQNEPSRPFTFLVACDEIIFGKNQISSFFSWCRPGGGFSFGGSPVLLGPDVTNSQINPLDDSSFELQFVEGYLGWDGDCEFGTVPVRIQFTKQ